MTAIKKILYVAAIAVWMAGLSNNALAQRRVPVFGMLSAGPSFAVDKFARHNSNSGAYASTGVDIKLSGGVFLTKNIGFELLATATFSPINDPYWGNGASYNYNSLLIGPVFSFPLYKRLDLDLKPSVGIIRQQLNLGFATDAYGKGVAYDFCVGMRYYLSSAWFLVLDTDYFRSNVNYNSDYRDIKTRTLNITFGGGFLF